MYHISVIVAPFHAGARCCRVGNGPHRLLEGGLVEALSAADAAIDVVEIAPVDAFEGEIGRTFQVKRRVAQAVMAARQARRFPLVLAGNCDTSVGVHAGLGSTCAGVVWFDAHPDFNTPDECTGGYFDCMGVSTLAGESWKALAASIPGFRPLDLSHLVYCGTRDFEPGQREKVEAHGVRAVYGSTSSRPRFSEELAIHLDAVSGPKLIHLDLDALDTSVGQANEYAAPGGLSANDLRACPELTVARSPPAAMTIAPSILIWRAAMRLPQPPSALHYPWLKLSFDRVGSSGRLAPQSSSYSSITADAESGT